MPGRLLRAAAVAVLPALVSAPAAFADDPPGIEHQPFPCTIPAKPVAVCATITDDSAVAKSRVYFRAAEEKFYSFVEMAFGGLEYCATLPAPREGKLKALEYYIQATDDGFNTQRTSTYQMLLQPEGACDFPPVEKDSVRAQAIKVFASHPRQGKKLPDEFLPAGVTWVPAPGR
jgi:hypothetical protein